MGVDEIVATLGSSLGDTTTARSLPGECYTSEEFFAFEKEALFMREWLCVGHHSSIPNPGDYFTLTLVDEPLVIVRGDDGVVRAMSSICQHRGHPVVVDSGTCSQFRCPYHWWSYGLDGRLVAAPEMRQTVPLPELRAEVRLPELKVELWHGLIFVTFDLEAAPLAPTLWRLERELEGFDVENLVATPAEDAGERPWNWKLHHENALEPYHTQFVHRGYHEMAPAQRAAFWDFEPDEGVVMHPTYFDNVLGGLDGGLNPMGTAISPVIEGLSDEQRRRVLFGSIPPTLFLSIFPNYIGMSILLPQSAGVTGGRRQLLYPRAVASDPKWEWIHQCEEAFDDVAGAQDAATTSTMQKALRSRFAPRGRYSHQEATLPQLNTWLVQRYQRQIERMAPVATPVSLAVHR
jgi:nitrite reductase/ring-hydroxylating ferredoxin subunit